MKTGSHGTRKAVTRAFNIVAPDTWPDAFVIGTDDSVRPIKPKNGKDFKLKEVQAVIGGYVEVIQHLIATPAYIMLVDEEGKFKDLDLNGCASVTYGCRVTGVALVCRRSMIQ